MASDPENPEWTEADFAASKGPEDLPPELLAAFPKTKRPRGRPAGSEKERIAIRVDRAVLDRFKAAGDGWQTRMNDVLRKAVGL